MSKQITIPSDKGTPVIVMLNGVKYAYTAGDTVTVPDEVAALFESNEVNAVQSGRHAAAPLTAPARYKFAAGGVPIQVDDNGNLYICGDAALDGIYVEGHKLIIPSTEE